MSYFDAVIGALATLRANPLRSLLTMLGIIIGVAAVMAVVAVASGARALVVGKIGNLGSNLLVISSGTITAGGLKLSTGSAMTLTEEDAHALRRDVAAVQYAVPIVRGIVRLVHDDRNWSTGLAGVGGDYLAAQDWSLDSGRGFSAGEMQSAAKVALLGQTAARRLFGDLDPVGAVVRIEYVPLTIVGLLASKGQIKGGDDQDDVIVTPLVTAKTRVLGVSAAAARAVGNIVVKVRDDRDVAAAAQLVHTVLRRQHRLGPQADDDFVVKNLAELVEVRQAAYRALTLLLGALAAVSLVVGGIGVMNIMLVSVTEARKHSRRAPPPRHPASVVESVTLALAGDYRVALGATPWSRPFAGSRRASPDGSPRSAARRRFLCSALPAPAPPPSIRSRPCAMRDRASGWRCDGNLPGRRDSCDGVQRAARL
jgi:putative ABC transport system permease protein